MNNQACPTRGWITHVKWEESGPFHLPDWSDYNGLTRNPFALRFSDGWIWDRVAGWRRERNPNWIPELGIPTRLASTEPIHSTYNKLATLYEALTKLYLDHEK